MSRGGGEGEVEGRKGGGEERRGGEEGYENIWKGDGREERGGENMKST